MKSRINKLDYAMCISLFNSICYYKNNLKHRDGDLPAIIWENIHRSWYKNGLEHRDENKPSSIYSDGYKYWYQNGNFIRCNKNEIENK